MRGGSSSSSSSSSSSGGGGGGGGGTYAKGLVIASNAYAAASNDELSFAKGDIIALLGKSSADIPTLSAGWWFGQLACGTVGIFPANYVRII